MAPRITIVDAFTDRPFAGNPAAVCVLERPAPEPWMQAVAAELNLSETAFVVLGTGDEADLRWFTPTVEVDLCGHATLAATHVLARATRFHTRSGLLRGRPVPGGVEIDLPANSPTPATVPPSAWAGALGVAPARVLGVWSAEGGWALVELASAADVGACAPDQAAIVALGGSVIVVADRCATTGATSAPATAPDTGTGRDTATDTPAGVSEGPGLAALGGSAGRVDSVCRVFVPGSGIAEDPVTGAAHCAIAPWLAARTGRTSFVGEQASARGGRVVMRVQGDRVVLRGAAVTVLTGALTAEPGRHAGGGTR